MPIEEILGEVDVAYLDGTFYAPGEVPGRDLSAVSHPFVSESLQRFAALSLEFRARIRFLHLNHTNPLLCDVSAESIELRAQGYRRAEERERVEL